MNDIDKNLLNTISGRFEFDGAYNIRKNGELLSRHITENINIVTKTDNPGIDVYISDGCTGETVDIPVILTEKGLNDTVYNDFYIGKDASVTIIAGCGIHNEFEADSEHDGVHTFHLEEGAKVKYIEKHYGDGFGSGKKILNPVTEIHLKKNSLLEMETSQIDGVDDAIRTTRGVLEDGATFVVNEKIFTSHEQNAKTVFDVKLDGKNSSVKVNSRAVATENSKQAFISKVVGNNECFGHVECDAILKDNAIATSDPTIEANCPDAKLIHEATIGKIAGEQLLKLMSLGLSKESAEQTIINGFLK